MYFQCNFLLYSFRLAMNGYWQLIKRSFAMNRKSIKEMCLNKIIPYKIFNKIL